ncbi:heat stress transcription factor B-3-like [Momordica charantia]|uniref:Heat stress transcription factor B-3-like n=1 Tax=Momordica charantia TaxID=3673 RepID=A0A6J1DH46_MOMCH|nr:heat stress transcription factor B-3-like [Momordica charantia]
MEAGVSNDRKGSPAAAAEEESVIMRKSTPPPFLVKTYKAVEDPATDDVISWNGDGTAFVVWQTAEFAKDVLPTLFKHCNFSSFVRQLNTYGFRKVATTRWEFCNNKFQKGEKEKLCEIRRRKAWTSNKQRVAEASEHHELDEDQRSSSSNSSSSEYNTLVDQNKRLKEENGALISELASMKNKCRELLDLVAKCGKKSSKEEEVDERPKLFGVRLEVEGERERKRKRGENNQEINETATFLLSQSCKMKVKEEKAIIRF